MSDDRRAQIRETMQALSEEPAEVVAEPVNGDVEVSANTDHPEVAPEHPPEASLLEHPPENEAQAEAQARARDGKGRFSKTKASKLATPPGQQTQAAASGQGAKPPQPVGGADSQAPAAQVKPPEPELKAPQSWTPAEREHFAKAPNEVRQAVLRREKEIGVALQESTNARRFHQDFHQAVSPFMGMIQAEGGEPLGAVKNLLQTAAALRTAPPAHKAKLVADIIRQFGVPIETLDAHLAGDEPQANQQQQQFDPRTIAQQVEQQIMQRMQQSRAQQAQVQGQRELESFYSKQPEFFEDVRDIMADIIEVDARNKSRLPDGHPSKLPLPLDEAYNRACKLHPEISKVREQREEAERAKARNASTQRAAAAASSVKSQPAGSVGARGPTTRMDALKATIAELSGR
jgi:hypothetical protein